MSSSRLLYSVPSLSSILFSLVLTLVARDATSQDQFNRFRHISTSDGFSLNSVNAIDQDEKGFIWFGTRNGLMRYDGINLRLIRRETGTLEQDGINDIYHIHIDSAVGVWVGSRYGLSIYYSRADSSKDFKWYQSISRVSSTRRVFDILRLNKSEVCIGGGRGLEIYNVNQGTVSVNSHSAYDPKSIDSDKVLSLCKSIRDSSLWVGTSRGINQVIGRSENGKLRFKRYSLDGSITNEHSVNTILEDRHGNLWVGTSEGLYLRKAGAKTFASFASRNGEQLTNRIIRCLTLDNKNRLWVGTYDGLNIIDGNHNIISKIRHDSQIADGLSGNNIRALFTDKHGGVWVATYFGGVNYWRENLVNFERIDESNGTRLGYNVVNSIVEDEHSNVYFGTEGNGVNLYNPSENQFSSLSKLSPGDQLETVKVKSLLYEGQGQFWIGTFDRGVIHLDIDQGNTREFTNKGFNTNSLSSDRVVTLEKSLDGNLWVGTLNTGLDLFDLGTGEFTNFRAEGGHTGITYNNVRALLVSKSGDLYVGTGVGLSMLPYSSYQNRKFKFRYFELEDGTTSNLTFHDIIEDRNGRIWLATMSSGLCYIERDKIKPANLDGVSSIFSIVESKNGVLWLSSQEGIVSYNPDSGEQRIYNSKDGVQPNEFNRGARFASSDGTIYFGGASGVTKFHPSNLGASNDYAPDVVLTKISLLGQDLNVNDETAILKRSIEYTEEITLNYDQNIFTIYFAMPNYINSDKNSYEYRLRGLDDTWVKTNNPFVSYTIQRGGDYTLEVKGVNSDGVKSSRITTLKIRVKNAPWLTGWAYLLYFVAFSSALLTFIYFFKSRLRLQHQLEMETRESLHQQEVHKQKLQFFTNISHEFRTPLTLISGPLEKLIADYKGPSYVFRQLLVIKKNTDQLFKLINELMDFRKLESKQMKLQAAEGDIVKFAKEIYLSFQQQAKLHKLNYTFHSEPVKIPVYFDRDKLEKVLYNLISNAFKYTSDKGAIEIKVDHLDTIARISVVDSGEGMSQDHLEKIFDRFYEIPKHKTAGKPVSGSGIGLAIAKNVVDLHRGELKVKSKQGKGSEFVMELRLGRDHLSDDEIIKSFKNSEDITRYSGYTSSEDVEYGQIELDEVEEKENQPKILIVEDNPDIAHFMHNILVKYYNITIAENGAMGFQEALSKQPDLIISDVMMPVMDGIEFCSKIKSDLRTSHILFILLTARTSLVYKYNGLESGADEYLSKPFEMKELVLKCKNLIKTQRGLKSRFSESGEFTSTEMSVNSMDEVMMNNAIIIIRENIGNEFFGIQLLCDKLGISRSLLFTKFKAWTNQTPNEYILSTRMKHAATLIEQNKINISEVGYKVGFKSANYFSKSFKKYYSMSPRAYAKKFTENLR